MILRGTRRGHFRRALLFVLALTVVALAADLQARFAAATFSYVGTVAAGDGAARIFSAERVTPAFTVTDSSGGTPVDVSSPLATAADGRTLVTSAWSAAFAANRYLDVDFNGPLPAGLTTVTASLRLSWASASDGSTACYYFEVRRASTGSVLGTFGSSGAPVSCVTGSAPVTSTTAIGVVTSTDVANDLRVRIYGRDSSGGGAVLDLATVPGDTGLGAFTLYAIKVVDAADTTPGTIGWGPSGP